MTSISLLHSREISTLLHFEKTIGESNTFLQTNNLTDEAGNRYVDEAGNYYVTMGYTVGQILHARETNSILHFDRT